MIYSGQDIGSNQLDKILIMYKNQSSFTSMGMHQ